MPRLDPADCRLLREEGLVQRYNAVHDILEEAASELPRFAEREVVAEVRADLARLAQTMTKKRFEIGFIGPSQVGKSATQRNLLSVTVEDAPTPEGSGAATTSLPTRTVPKPPGPGVDNSVELRYFSRLQFLQRVRDICDLVKIRFDEDLARIRDAARDKHREDPHFKAADLEVLEKLIAAALAFPEVLQEPGLVEKGAWADRRLYTTHQDAVSKNTLLREVCIEFVTDAISPEIEMIDLPGIDVDKGSDARLTLAFVRTLDGALMVQAGQQVRSSSIAQLAEVMRELYGPTLGERIWMVVTLCDNLTDLHIHGPSDQPDQPTMFCHLAQLMRQQGIVGRNVHFIGNGYYADRRAAGLDDTERASAAMLNRYPTVLRFDAGGRPLVPERCSRHPDQVGPWGQLLLNGGIASLRETLQTMVAESVREQTRREVSRRVIEIIDRLVAALLAAEQQSSMSVDEMMRAVRWSGELDRLADEVGRDERYSLAAATAIHGVLDGVIGDWGSVVRASLTEDFRQLASALALAGQQEAAMQTSAVVALVHKRLKEGTRTLPPPDAAGLPKPLEHWADATKCLDRGRTVDDRDFRGPIFSSFVEDPSPLADGCQNMSPAEFPIVMRFKAARVARVYGSRLVQEIQSHLQRLRSRYRAVGTEAERVDAGQRERYAKYRSELERLRI